MKIFGFCKDSKCGAEVVPAENFKVLTGSIAMKSGSGGTRIAVEEGEYYLLSLGLRTTWHETNEYVFENYDAEMTPTLSVYKNEVGLSLKDTSGARTGAVQYKILLLKVK